MDPLTITSAVAGLITTTTRVTPLLYQLVTHTRDAPKSAARALAEIESISAVLRGVQLYVLGGEKTESKRRSLVSLEDLFATLVASVLEFSELEKVVGKCVDGMYSSLRVQ
jgi:hypothetical protein